MPAPRKIDREQVVALRAAGEGVRAIARALGAAPSSISRILRRPEVSERVERERERLAATARVGERTWLLVRGGSWGFGSRRGAAVVGRSFPGGLYLEVDEEVVAFVERANSRQLLLGRGEPPASERIKRVRALSWERRVLAEAEVTNGAYRLELPEGAAVERVVALDEDGSPVGADPW